MAADDVPPTTKIQDGVRVQELLGLLLTAAKKNPKARVRFLPETWGNGQAEMHLNLRRDGELHVEIFAIYDDPNLEAVLPENR